jgi:hypothetical protein
MTGRRPADEIAALRAELAEARARIRELELRLHLRPWTQFLPPIPFPRQRRPVHDTTTERRSR